MLSQNLADSFIKLPKVKFDDTQHTIAGVKNSIPLIGMSDPQEEFILDINKHIIRLDKYTLQNRVRRSVGLIRVDFGAGGHTNPDGIILKGPHIHIYKEGFDLKWAYPIPYASTEYGDFLMGTSLMLNLEQFFKICNIVAPPNIQGTLL